MLSFESAIAWRLGRRGFFRRPLCVLVLVYLLSLAVLCFSGVALAVGDSAAALEERPPHSTFPFYLNCKGDDDLQKGKHSRIVLSYHVDMVNNWEEIVRDQMHTLDGCGLGRAASALVITYSHGSESDLSRVLENFPFATDARYFPVAKRPNQQGSQTSVTSAMCSGSPEEEKTVVFFFHAMGSEDYHWDWWRHKSQIDEGPYSRSLYWRKYNEYFTLENPSLCVERLNEGSLTCGVNFKVEADHWRYCDDFWASTCDHVLTLPAMDTPASGETPAGVCEAKYIGSGKSATINPNSFSYVRLHNMGKDRQKHIPYPEEYDETASRFRLTCPQEDLPKGKYKLTIVYHVGMINNWRETVSDQLQTIERCGLGRNAETFILSYSNGDPGELLDLIKSFDILPEPVIVHAEGSPWECPANNATLHHCKAKQDVEEEKTIVFYMHNKGSSRYTPNWRKKMDGGKSYAKSLYWRKFIEAFHAARPSLCINKILDGGLTCGSAIRGRHYSGNFWVASCEYIVKLKPCGFENTGYIESEHWLGKAMGGGSLDPKKYVQLFEAPHIEGGARMSLLYLYRHLILPEEYADETYGAWKSGLIGAAEAEKE